MPLLPSRFGSPHAALASVPLVRDSGIYSQPPPGDLRCRCSFLVMSFFLDVATSLASIPLAVLDDALGLITRPLVLLYAVDRGAYSPFAPFAQGGLVVGFLGTFSALLILGSIARHFSPRVTADTAQAIARFVCFPYAIDAAAQLLGMLVIDQSVYSYPVARTGLGALGVLGGSALLYTSDAFLRAVRERLPQRLCMLPLAILCRFWSVALLRQSGPVAALLYGLALCWGIGAAAPPSVWGAVGKRVERLEEWLKRVGAVEWLKWMATICWTGCESVRAAVTRCWPEVKRFGHMVLVLTHLDHLEHALAPCWRVLSPGALPLATALIALSCADVVVHGPAQDIAPVHRLVLFAGCALCGAAASLSTGILAVHAAGRARAVQMDPFESPRVVSLLTSAAALIALPWDQTGRVAQVYGGPLVRGVRGGVAFCDDCVKTVPIITILVVLLVNYVLFASGALEALLSLLAWTANGFAKELSTVSLDNAGDTVLAVVLIALSQVSRCWMRLSHRIASHRITSYRTAQNSTDGTALHGTARHSTAQHSTAQHSTAQHSTAHHSTPQHITAQHSTAQHSTAQHGIA